jgi:hypothetical protein
MYPSGGHVWVGHNEDLFGRVDAFLQKHSPGESTANEAR